MNKDILKQEIKSALAKIKIETTENDIELVIPSSIEHGNFSTNFFLKNSKKAGKSPVDFANEFVKQFKVKGVEKVEVAKNGFVNFYLTSDKTNNVVNEILSKGTEFGKLSLGKGKVVNFEFVSANPTGYLHIGHARGAAYGDSMVKIMEAAGYKVIREYWLNDYGVQIKNMAKSIHAKYMLNFDKNFPMVEDGYNGYDIVEASEWLFKQVGDKFNKPLDENISKEISELGMKYFIDQIHLDLGKINIPHYDHFSSEKDCYEKGQVKEILATLEKNGGLYKQDGATWLKTTKHGDDKDRVLIKSDGETTYLVADIAGHDNKFKRNPDLILNVFGADHHGYEVRLKSSQSWLGHDASKMEIQFIQMVRLVKDGAEFKMSKRAGTVVTLREMFDEIGVNELRYFMIYKSINQMFDLDLEFVKSNTSNNPVYYSLYAYARAHQLIEKAKSEIKGIKKVDTITSLTTEAEQRLIQSMSSYSQAIERAVKSYEPSIITNYIYELAKNFHSFYGTSKIMGVDAQLQNERYSLVMAFKQLLSNAFSLVGIVPNEKM